MGIGSLLFAIISLADGVAFLRRITASSGSRSSFQPKAVVLIPVRGLDPIFEKNLHALLNQQYGEYRLVFIVDQGDETEGHLREVEAKRPLSIVRSKPLRRCSGKIAALLAGLEHVEEDDEIVVFADGDIEPDLEWLAHLVAPLEDSGVAASTGYRWYFPTRGGLGPALQSTWNSAAGNVMFSERWTYLWGGSYAIRREVLKELRIEERWERCLSDDMIMTQALKEKGHRISFAPRATVANYTDHSFSDVLRWTNRQTCLALMYAPTMKRLTLPYVIYAASLLLAAASGFLATLSMTFLLPTLLLLSPVYLGLWKNFLRRVAFRRAMPAFSRHFSRFRFWFYLASTLIPFLMIYNVRTALRMREFEWRGKIYKFTSPEDVTVLRP